MRVVKNYTPNAAFVRLETAEDISGIVNQSITVDTTGDVSFELNISHLIQNDPNPYKWIFSLLIDNSVSMDFPTVQLATSDKTDRINIGMSMTINLTAGAHDVRIQWRAAPGQQNKNELQVIPTSLFQLLCSAESPEDLVGTITNEDIAADAEIEFTKMEPLTPSVVPVLDASGFIVPSSVTDTELGFLDATSSIQGQFDDQQTQLDDKAPAVTTYSLWASNAATGIVTNGSWQQIDTNLTKTQSTEAGTYRVFCRTSSFGDVAAPDVNVSWRVNVDSGSQFVTNSSWISRHDIQFQRQYQTFIGYVTLTAASHTFALEFNGTATRAKADANDFMECQLEKIG